MPMVSDYTTGFDFGSSFCEARPSETATVNERNYENEIVTWTRSNFDYLERTRSSD